MENTLSPIMIMLIGLAAPMTSGLICLFIVGLYRYQNKDPEVKLTTKVLLLELVLCVFCWFSLICYWGATHIFVYIHWLFLFSLLHAQVQTYRFIFIHTGIKRHERFSIWHNLWPIIPTAMLFVCLFLYPSEVREYIVSKRPPFTEEYLYYNLLTQSVPLLFLVTNMTYSTLGLRRIIRYREEVVNFSADESHTSLKWLKLLIFVAISSLPLALIPSVMGTQVVISSLLTSVGMFAIVLKDVILIHNTMIRNYVLIYPIAEETPLEDNIPTEKTSTIHINVFEKYIHSQKPYLNPDLRITDLIGPLGTNRTYLSAFINTQYGVNFSQYINRLRLNEFDYIRKQPENAHIEDKDLVHNVGFNNYRTYLRLKQNEEKQPTVGTTLNEPVEITNQEPV